MASESGLIDLSQHVEEDELVASSGVKTVEKEETIGEKVQPTQTKKRKRGPTKVLGKKPSDVWLHFTKFDSPLIAVIDGKETLVGSEKRAQCKYFHTHLACDYRGNGTSSLRKHIEVVCKCYSGRVDLEQVQQVLGRELVNGEQSLTSVVWSQQGCTNAATRMIVLDELPFSFIENVGFRHFCDVAVPRWEYPCRKLIVKNFLRMYEAKKNELKAELQNHCVCLTTDTWTSCQNINYMVITAHFIDHGWKMHKRVLKFCVIQNHQGTTIGKILENALIEWSINRVLTISMDNASANKVAIDYVRRKMSSWNRKLLCEGMFMHVRCLADIVNLIVRSGLKIMEKSVAAIRNAIRYVRSSPARLDCFKMCVEQEKVECKKICILDVRTRWNSSFLMLDTALELRKAFDRMADDDDVKHKDLTYFDEDEDSEEEDDIGGSVGQKSKKLRKRVGPPKDADWEKAKVFVNFLRVFYQVTVNVSASLHPTSHLAFHDIVSIKAEIDELYFKPVNEKESDSDPAKLLFNMANTMRIKYKKYFEKLDDMNHLFIIALVLDPRYKMKCFEMVCLKMLGLGRFDVKRRSESVKELLVNLCDLYAQSSRKSRTESSGQNSIRDSTNTKKQKESGPVRATGKKRVMLDDWNKQLEEGEEMVVGHEVDRYLLDAIEKSGDEEEKWNILDWWRLNGNKYPNLQLVAKDVLAIQVSTVASESRFSTGKRVIDPHRTSMTPKTIEALICFQNWLKSDSIMGLEYTPTVEEMEFYEAIEKEHQEEEINEFQATQNSNFDDNDANGSKTKTAKVSMSTNASKSSKTKKMMARGMLL